MDRLGGISAHFASICSNIKQVSISADKGAQNAVEKLKFAEKSGRSLQSSINQIVAQSGGWSEYIAKTMLRLVEAVIKAGAPMGAAMREAYNRSADAAGKCTTFAKDHPILCTVIALGILMILAATVITALGFSGGGVVKGSFAAVWQSTYGGFVAAGSWFAYFQKLGTIVG